MARSKIKKHYKRLVKLMYRKGILEADNVKIEDCVWDECYGNGMDTKDYGPALYMFTTDYWGEGDQDLIDYNLEFILLTKEENRVWTENEHDWDHFPNRLRGIKTTLGFIKIIEKMPDVKRNKKFNPKCLMRTDYGQ